MSKTIYVLTIEHAHGRNLSAHQSQEGALAGLAAYVAQEWSREMPAGEAMPPNEGEAIEAYFARLEGIESYGIEETELED